MSDVDVTKLRVGTLRRLVTTWTKLLEKKQTEAAKLSSGTAAYKKNRSDSQTLRSRIAEAKAELKKRGVK